MAEQVLTYKKLESLSGELNLEKILRPKQILDVPYVGEELNCMCGAMKPINPNLERMFGDKYRAFLFLFDVILSSDGVKDIYLRAAQGKMPQLRGLGSTIKFNVIFRYNQQSFRVFNITGDGISLRNRISNSELPTFLRNVLQRVRLTNSVYSDLTKELEPCIEDFESRVSKIKKANESKLPPEAMKIKKKIQIDACVYDNTYNWNGAAGI